MQRLSPPKHRHDGTSPLPLGMDYSPPPRNWAGRETIWPHDPRTGWSYCITVPSWIVLAMSRDSDPIVFYRVQVGLQSPEGITTTRTVLRRFNDFLKLHAALKRTFPGKYIPPTPPKGLMQMKTRGMLEMRRSSLEEWMTKLLSDIDVSRSIVVASFLELEAAARSSFQEDGQSDSHISQSAAHSTLRVPDASSLSAVAGSSSLASDYGSDTAYEASEIGSPCPGRDNNSELSMEDLSYYDSITSPVDKFLKYGMSNIDEGLSMGQSIIEKLEGFPRHKLRATELHFNSEHNTSNVSSSKASRSEPDHSTVVRHVRKLSNESIGSDRSSDRGSELSNIAFPKSNGLRFGLLDSGAEDLRKSGTVDVSDDVHLLVPTDQSQMMNRLLTTLQRKLITAKTDMEDLISRLNQEIAVKDYLSTKVNDLEVELETTKQKGKENLEQAMLIERERVTQMQWDMEELRQRAMELELKLNSEQAQSMDTQSTISSTISHPHKDVLHQELDSAKQKFEDLLKRHQELEVRSKADIKILVKEVKSLRSSHAELTKQLDQSLKEKSQATELLQEEKERNEQTRTSWGKFLRKCKILHDQLQEFHMNNLKHTEEDDIIGTSESDSQISLLISEVQRFGQDTLTNDRVAELDDDSSLRQMLTSILVDNGVLRKQVNSLIVQALKTNESNEKANIESESDVNVKQ